MVICKRPERVGGLLGWRLLNQALGGEAYSTYRHLDTRNNWQCEVYRNINSEILTSIGGGVCNPSPYRGHESTVWQVQSSCSHLDWPFACKGSLGNRAFATQSFHLDNSSSDIRLSKSDTMEILSSDNDRNDGSMTGQHTNAYDEDEDRGIAVVDAMDSHSSEGDTRNEEDSCKMTRHTKVSRFGAGNDDEGETDSGGDEDDLKTSSLLDAACENVDDGLGDKERPLWMRLEEATEKKSSTLKDVLEAWTDEGNPLNTAVIIWTITILRRRREYWKALELSDWVMMEKPFPLNDMDYGIRIELIGKVQGAKKAADYSATIPKQFQTPVNHSILMIVYVQQRMEKEALSLLKKVDRPGLEHRTYMYNQLLNIYKKKGLMAGVTEVLQRMDEKDVEPDTFTYNIILDMRARKGDATGMEKIWSRVKADRSIVPDAATYGILTKGYIIAGLYDKAEKCVKKIESSPFKRKRAVNVLLLNLYGQLGKEEELERVWGLLKQGPRPSAEEFTAMIRALGKVGNVDRAEDIYEEMTEEILSLTIHHYNALLSVYANVGRIQKGESLLKRMAKASIIPNPKTYHELVLMYLKADEEQKAMAILSKVGRASRSIKRRPMYVTYQAALEWFADKGDVKNSENVIRDLKGAGYPCSYRSYSALLRAYANSESSPYGFLNRLRGDNIIPNQHIRNELRRLEGT